MEDPYDFDFSGASSDELSDTDVPFQSVTPKAAGRNSYVRKQLYKSSDEQHLR